MGIKWIPSIIFKELLYVCTWCTSWRAFLCEQDMLFDSFSFIMHSDLKGLWALVASFGHKHVLLHAYLQPNDLPSPAFTTYRWTCKFYWPQFDIVTLFCMASFLCLLLSRFLSLSTSQCPFSSTSNICALCQLWQNFHTSFASLKFLNTPYFPQISSTI